MLASAAAASAASPLRLASRQLAAAASNFTKWPGGGGDGQRTAASLSRFCRLGSSSASTGRDDDDDSNIRSRYDLSTMTPLSSRVLCGALAALPPPVFILSRWQKPQKQQQLRSVSTGNTRSSTTAAHPPSSNSGTSFSSKAPISDRHSDGGDEHSNVEHMSRLERGRDVAKKGAIVARKGAISVRDLFKKYGWTFVGTYFVIYWGTVAAIFAGIDSGLIDPATVVGYVKSFGVSAADGMAAEGAGTDAAAAADTKSTVDMIAGFLEKYEWTSKYAESVRSNPHAANFGLAWFATKFTEPVRLGATLVFVPRVHRALGGKTQPEDEQHGGEADKGQRRKIDDDASKK